MDSNYLKVVNMDSNYLKLPLLLIHINHGIPEKGTLIKSLLIKERDFPYAKTKGTPILSRYVLNGCGLWSHFSLRNGAHLYLLSRSY